MKNEQTNWLNRVGNHSPSVSCCGIHISLFGFIEMNIQTVADNLRNTITGKEIYLASLSQGLKEDLTDGAYAAQAIAQMLEINIGELKRILADVEQCIEETA